MRLDAKGLAAKLNPPATGLTGIIEKVSAPGAAAQGDDFISRVNDAITNFKGLLGAAQAAKLDVRGRAPQGDDDPGGGFDLRGLARLLIDQGLGDTPLGVLAKQVEGVTLNQIRGLLGGNRPQR